MSESRIMNIIGIRPVDSEFPSDLMVVRDASSMSSVRSELGGIIANKFGYSRGEDVGEPKPIQLVETVMPERLGEIARGLGVAATDPEAIVAELQTRTGLTVHEVNNVGEE